MPKEKVTLGQAIDTVIEALEPLDGNARQTVLAAVCSHLEIGIGRPTPTAGALPPGPGAYIGR